MASIRGYGSVISMSWSKPPDIARDAVQLSSRSRLTSAAMDRVGTADTDIDIGQQRSTTMPLGKAQRAFSLSMLVSAIRCVLAYVVLPFVTPFLGLAPGVGPGLGIIIGTVAIGANVFSMQRFWRLNHPWRRPITALHIAVIAFLLVLVAMDTLSLLGPTA